LRLDVLLVRKRRMSASHFIRSDGLVVCVI
jgi:hypothetical protein